MHFLSRNRSRMHLDIDSHGLVRAQLDFSSLHTFTRSKMSGIRILVPVKRVIDYAVSTHSPL
jgi:hypothetical protein